MSWYLNSYHCAECETDWSDEWSCCCDDECPNCGSRNWSPMASEDRTFIVEAGADGLVIYESPETADDRPNYQIVALAPTLGAADAYVKWRMASR